MSALEWIWYMRPTIMASADGRWRIYRSVNARTQAVVYTLMRKTADAGMTRVLQAPTAIECRQAAQDMVEDAA